MWEDVFASSFFELNYTLGLVIGQVSVFLSYFAVYLDFLMHNIIGIYPILACPITKP
jgi:hypothetical protein